VEDAMEMTNRSQQITHLAEKMGMPIVTVALLPTPADLRGAPTVAPARKHDFQEIAEYAMCGVGANLDVVPSKDGSHLGVVGPSLKDVMDRLFGAMDELYDPGLDFGREIVTDGFSNMRVERFEGARGRQGAVYVWFPSVPYTPYVEPEE
jgi:hypothetical protein